MKIRTIIQQTFNTIIILALVGLMFLLAFKGYKNSTIDLSKADVYEGTVTGRGTKDKPSEYGSQKVFYLSLGGLNQDLATYDKSQDYSTLLKEINVGDQVKVYYKKSTYKEVNIDVYQIENSNKIILDKKEYEGKEKALIYIGVIGGVAMLGIGLWQFKYGKTTSTNTKNKL